MSDKDGYFGILLEEVRDDVKRLAEAVGSLMGLPKAVQRLENDVTELKTDVKVIKAVITGHSSQLANHEKRITKLEQHRPGAL